MRKFDNLEEVAQYLGDGGPFSSDTTFDSNEKLVDALVRLGNSDKVYASHDDHMGLKSDLSQEFLDSHVEDDDKFESETQDVLEQANIIIPLAERDLSEDDVEDIIEDMAYRGKDPEDMDI